MDFFYPNWSNDMWRIWGLIYKNDPGAFIDPERKCFKQDELTVFLEGAGVALYDTAQAVLRKMANASDKYLDIQQRTDITQLLENLPLCRAIAATGQKACETLGETLCLPHLPAIGQWVPFNYNGPVLSYAKHQPCLPATFGKKSRILCEDAGGTGHAARSG